MVSQMGLELCLVCKIRVWTKINMYMLHFSEDLNLPVMNALNFMSIHISSQRFISKPDNT